MFYCAAHTTVAPGSGLGPLTPCRSMLRAENSRISATLSGVHMLPMCCAGEQNPRASRLQLQWQVSEQTTNLLRSGAHGRFSNPLSANNALAETRSVCSQAR